MQAREDAASIVEVRTFKDHYEENKHIIYTIKEEMAKKTPLSQIAILYRTNQGPRQLIAALMAYNIPFYMQDAVPNLFDTYEAWFDHIKEYTEELNRQSKENQKEKEGVVVSTMHSTKGLEFERVFLPDVNEDVIPHKKSMKEEDVEEERRLFYVGVTRAKKYLHILSVKKLYNKDSRPSRFVEELRSRQEKRGVLHGK